MRLKADHIRRFLFDLAERLGKTVAQLERELGTAEIVEWMAVDELNRSKPKRRRWKQGSATPISE